MILSFTMENWMSFRDAITFSMIASKERQHGERLYKLQKYESRILPVAAVYGGNASGKTNFFKALSFMKKFVVSGSLPDSLIQVEPYRLGESNNQKPSSFKIVLHIEESIYEFSFAASRKRVLRERLVQINSKSERVLYEREENKIKMDPRLDKDPFHQFAFQGTRENQLYLTNSVFQRVMTFRPVYDWFRDCLDLVAPDARFMEFEQFINTENEMYEKMNTLLSKLDTGIVHLGGEIIPMERLQSQHPFSEKLINQMEEDIKEGQTVRIDIGLSDRYVITRTDGYLQARRLVSYHQNEDGKEMKFEMSHESDGTLRVIDLLPAFLSISEPSNKKVYVIDELDRSLHTLLTRQLISLFLNSRDENTRSQLLFTTHDVLLMDQDLLRRDEMWVAERLMDGSSTLRSFSEYRDVRYDKDIRKSYLQGRLGGIPRIMYGENIRCDQEAE